jgi:hypothetical protein
MIHATRNVTEVLGFSLYQGAGFTILGAYFLLISRGDRRSGKKMIRDGAWRNLRYGDAAWMGAKPFFFGGLGFLAIWAVGELLIRL